MKKEYIIDNIYNTMEWAEKCIEEYNLEDFDPIACMMGEGTRQQKMMVLSAQYLAEIKRLTEEFRFARRIQGFQS